MIASHPGYARALGERRQTAAVSSAGIERGWIGKTLHDIDHHPCKQIVVAVDRQRPHEAHRAYRENRATRGRFKEADVGADELVAPCPASRGSGDPR